MAAVGQLLADRGRCRILLALADGRPLPTVRGARLAGVADELDYRLTAIGHQELSTLGAVLPPRLGAVRCCIDWTEQLHHIAGPLGTAVLNAFDTAGWITPAPTHRARRPVPETRSFEEREPPFRQMSDDDRLAALQRIIADLVRVLERGLDEPDTWVPWTGRRMKVAWFGEHMRSELILHRWDLVGDDDQATSQLAQPWMTTHSVDAVGVPLLRRGDAGLPDTPFTSRLRVADQPDVVLTGGATNNHPRPRRPRHPARPGHRHRSSRPTALGSPTRRHNTPAQ